MILNRLFALSLSLLAITPVFADPAFSKTQQKAIQSIIHDYLIQNPQVLVEASQVLQAQQAQLQQQNATAAILANKGSLFNDPNTPAVGPNHATTVVEFFDYQCGHCRTVSAVVQQLMARDKNVRFIFKELPIFGNASEFAAKVALAAHKQNKYLALHNKLFSADAALSQEMILNFAADVGLDKTALMTEIQSSNYSAQLQQNFALAGKIGITGTPAFVIANKAQTKFQFIPGEVGLQALQDAINTVQK